MTTQFIDENDQHPTPGDPATDDQYVGPLTREARENRRKPRDD